MKLKDIVMLVLAAACGFLGGTAVMWRQSVSLNATAVNTTVMRTARVELVDASDRTRAVLGMDNARQEITLSFFTTDGSRVVSLGVERSDMPFLRLMGTGEVVRAHLRPTGLALGSGIRERVVLGDANGYSGLWLSDRSSESVIARLTMEWNSVDEPYSGSLFVRNTKKSFQAPEE
jgi:hypothetical protein